MKKRNLKQLANAKFKDIPQFSNHKFPTSRRDFMKLGLIAGGGLIVPSLFPAIAKSELINPRIPFLTFDLAGGASLPGNFLVGKNGGPEDLARNYQQNGWDPRLGGSLDKTFGLPMSARESGILRGLKETLPRELQNVDQTKFKMSSHLHFSLDDTGVNKTSALSYISKSGLRGSLLTNGIGHVSSLSGGNAATLLEDSKFKPRIVSNINDILSLTSLGRSFDALSEDSKSKLILMLQQTADSKSQQDYAELLKLGGRHERGDPQNDPIVSRLYNMNDQDQLLQSAIVLNVLKKYTGPGVITIAGCDYHNGRRDTGDQKDLEIGRAIGSAVHAAYLNETPLFFQIITDGGMTAGGFDRNWQGDSPLRSMTVMGYFNPKKSVEQKKLQIGHVTENGEVDISNPISSTADKGAISTLVNYLYVNDDIAALEKVFSRMSTQDIEDLLVFV
jgi:hypothetical protein